MTPAEILHAVERAGARMWWDPRANLLMVDDASVLPPAVDAAITENVRPLIALVSRIGCRVGYRYIRTRWHVVIDRFGHLETSCGVHVLGEPAPVRELPPYAPGGELCSRCIRAMVARELARLDVPRVPR